jgi:hypothetical protein
VVRVSEQGLELTLQLLDVCSTGAAGRCIWKLDGAGLEDGPAGEFAAGEEGPPAKGVGEPATEEDGEEEAVEAEDEEDGTIGVPPEEPPTETDTAGPVDSPGVGETVALGAGVPTAEGAAGSAPPVPGPSGAASRAGAIPKPTIAISATTRVHHGFERSAVMTECNVDSPQFIKP